MGNSSIIIIVVVYIVLSIPDFKFLVVHMGFYIADELNKDGPALFPPFVDEVSPQGHHHDITERPPWHH